MRIAIRHAWLQKHPSPAAARGEFHWYPPDGDRELRASFVERSRGIEAPAVLWQLAPGRVSWARVFAATAPIDGRRYVGLVLTTAEAEGASPADLLEALEVPEAAPWSEAGEAGEAGEGREALDPRDVREAAGERVASAVEAAPDHRLARARRWSARGAAAIDGDHDDDLAAAGAGSPVDAPAGRRAGAGSPVAAPAGRRAGAGSPVDAPA
ncbi:MAG TPA: hypothetical protein VK932_01455, partial [Kofleriaceae bacterium]|nr:hypothetical protein [Kofleriaceae bacterium]